MKDTQKVANIHQNVNPSATHIAEKKSLLVLRFGVASIHFDIKLCEYSLLRVARYERAAFFIYSSYL